MIPTMKILFQARMDIFTNPGGDTEVLTKLKRGLEETGMHVAFSCNVREPLEGYDLVHLFNMDVNFAMNAAHQKTPYVVTPLYEDFNSYYGKSMVMANLYRDYLQSGNDHALEERLDQLRREQSVSEPSDATFLVENAERLLVTGESEGLRIKRQFPGAARITIVPLGIDSTVDPDQVDAGIFESEYGVSDFVLSVGRMETRKNQLSLLYALKDEDIPVVFINSRTPMPQYEELCSAFSRKGRTIVTGRVSPEMLHAAFKAARVHALPSWYELPGLVSLEAAYFGCSIVASDCGTTRDYLGDCARYCSPDSPDSIRQAVLDAWQTPTDPGLVEKSNRFGWERTISITTRIYRKVLSQCRTPKGRRRLNKKMDKSNQALSFHRMRERANRLSQKDPSEALEIAGKLLAFRPKDAILFFIRGVASLALKNYDDAETSLRRSIELQPHSDIKGHLYLACLLLNRKKFDESLDVLNHACQINPFVPEKTKCLLYEYRNRCYEGIGDRPLTLGVVSEQGSSKAERKRTGDGVSEFPRNPGHTVGDRDGRRNAGKGVGP